MFFPTRPARAEALSPGHRPGLFWAQTCRPVRAKALKLQAIHKASALSGRAAYRSFWAFSPYLNHLRKFS